MSDAAAPGGAGMIFCRAMPARNPAAADKQYYNNVKNSPLYFSCPASFAIMKL
jgi:hypothetical protein